SFYSFQACRPPTRMLVDSQFCNKLQCRDSGFVHSFQACRPPTRMLVDSQFCNKLQCRDSGFVQSLESQPLSGLAYARETGANVSVLRFNIRVDRTESRLGLSRDRFAPARYGAVMLELSCPRKVPVGHECQLCLVPAI